MAANDEQVEELEVLSSIYEDDDAYTQISETCIQYKIGEESSMKSFLVEFVWPEKYPHDVPQINLNAFYNNKLLPEVKQHILDTLNEQAQNMVGEAMTFSLIDFAKENEESLLTDQPETIAKPVEKEQPIAKKKEKKEQLTKAQKRRLADRFGAGEERPRGWNWVDIVKHLSQTGKINENPDS